MAKRPRMGRNLDALLGGATRDRSARAAAPAEHGVTGNDLTDRADAAPDEAEASDASAVESARAEAASESAAEGGDRDASTASESRSRSDTDPASEAPAGAASGSVSSAVADTVSVRTAETSGTTDRLRMIGVDQIRRGSYQPRRLFDPELLQELADSIKAEGMIQPIIVRPFAGAFELVAGERRWRAAQLAGLGEIPAIVRDMQDQSVAAVALIENIQRKDLNPLEEAAAFERLCDEFGMTHKAVAESVGRSRVSVTNLMRLLELHDEVKVLVDRGELEMGHARALLGAPRDRQHELARDVIRRGLTVRAVEKLVRDMAAGDEPAAKRNAGPVSDPDIERLSQKLGETLGAPVKIQHKPDGRGKLEINYASVAELQGILAHIK